MTPGKLTPAWRATCARCKAEHTACGNRGQVGEALRLKGWQRIRFLWVCRACLVSGNRLGNF